MKNCNKASCLFYGLTILVNCVMIGAILLLAADSYGDEAQIILLFLIPPVLSLIALYKGGDKEERALKKRIRKANLRKELEGLKEFDNSQ